MIEIKIRGDALLSLLHNNINSTVHIFPSYRIAISERAYLLTSWLHSHEISGHAVSRRIGVNGVEHPCVGEDSSGGAGGVGHRRGSQITSEAVVASGEAVSKDEPVYAEGDPNGSEMDKDFSDRITCAVR